NGLRMRRGRFRQILGDTPWGDLPKLSRRPILPETAFDAPDEVRYASFPRKYLARGIMPMKNCCLFFAAGLLGLVFGAPLLAGQDDPFDSKFQDDPFALENKFHGSKKSPQAPKSAGITDRIDFAVSISPKEAAPGQVVKLTITGRPKPGFHIYAFT